jgi:hypothetical protein
MTEVQINSISLNESNDSVVWKWTTNKCFTVKSLYEHLIKDDNGPTCRT